MTSDRHPRSIATLEDRLRSRFEWGLITDVQPPELETRLAIVRKKTEGDQTPIPNDVLELIATRVTDNVRDLEGALHRVAALSRLNPEPLTVELAETVLPRHPGHRTTASDHPQDDPGSHGQRVRLCRR